VIGVTTPQAAISGQSFFSLSRRLQGSGLALFLMPIRIFPSIRYICSQVADCAFRATGEKKNDGEGCEVIFQNK
jgi:hypothetical protein